MACSSSYSAIGDSPDENTQEEQKDEPTEGDQQKEEGEEEQKQEEQKQKEEGEEEQKEEAEEKQMEKERERDAQWHIMCLLSVCVCLRVYMHACACVMCARALLSSVLVVVLSQATIRVLKRINDRQKKQLLQNQQV